MAQRSRKKAATSPAEDTSFNPAEFDQGLQQPEIVQSVAESTSIEQPTSAPTYIANPSSRRRETHVESSRRLPDKMTVTAGDLKVHLVNAGRNEMGIGIQVEFPQGRKPTDEEKEIIRQHIKGEEGQPSGFNWSPDAGLWLKHILREGEHVDDVPPSRPVAIRLDAERRVQNLAEALKEHSADPVGYAEMVKQRREQGSDRIPD